MGLGQAKSPKTMDGLLLGPPYLIIYALGLKLHSFFDDFDAKFLPFSIHDPKHKCRRKLVS